MTRRILQAKGLDPQKDVTLLSMDTPARLQSLMTGKVSGGMMTPPSTYLAMDQGYKVFGRGRDYMRFLQTGVVATDTYIKQRREPLVRFLRAWNRALKFYQDNPEVMLPYIQKKLGVKDAQLARRMYDDDAPYILPGGRLSPDAMKEIVEIGREALRIKEPDIGGSSFRLFIGHRSPQVTVPSQKLTQACASAQFIPVCTSTARPHCSSTAWVIFSSISARACASLPVGTSNTSSSCTVRSILATGSFCRAASTLIIAFLMMSAALP